MGKWKWSLTVLQRRSWQWTDRRETSSPCTPNASFTTRSRAEYRYRRARKVHLHTCDRLYFYRLFGSAAKGSVLEILPVFFELLTVCTGISWLLYLFSPDFNTLTHGDFLEDNSSEDRGSWKTYQGWTVLVSNTIIIIIIIIIIICTIFIMQYYYWYSLLL